MENVTTIDLYAAIIGFLIRWLLHLNSAFTKVSSRPEDKFQFSIYFKNNSVLLALSLVATTGLLLVVPEFLQSVDMFKYWSPMAAIGCGMSNIELVDIIKRKFMDKVKKEADDNDKKDESVKP